MGVWNGDEFSIKYLMDVTVKGIKVKREKRRVREVRKAMAVLQLGVGE